MPLETSNRVLDFARVIVLVIAVRESCGAFSRFVQSKCHQRFSKNGRKIDRYLVLVLIVGLEVRRSSRGRDMIPTMASDVADLDVTADQPPVLIVWLIVSGISIAKIS
jgi:hypothetical protein